MDKPVRLGKPLEISVARAVERGIDSRPASACARAQPHYLPRHRSHIAPGSRTGGILARVHATYQADLRGTA